ncbi:MAG: zinc-ribbon domain-containing protein [Gaiellaceae bacterium]
MAGPSLLDRFRRRPADAAPQAAPQPPAMPQGRVPAPGALRRERRALVRTREERIRDLGGLMLEMYRRDQFRQDLLVEQCLEVVTIEERLRDIDSLLEAAVTARRQGLGYRCECGAPILWGSHFCANCGRPVGEEPIVSCPSCGNALAADARFCPHCGAAAPEEPQAQAGNGAPADESQGEGEGEAQPPGERDSWER